MRNLWLDRGVWCRASCRGARCSATKGRRVVRSWHRVKSRGPQCAWSVHLCTWNMHPVAILARGYWSSYKVQNTSIHAWYKRTRCIHVYKMYTNRSNRRIVIDTNIMQKLHNKFISDNTRSTMYLSVQPCRRHSARSYCASGYVLHCIYEPARTISW